MSPTPAPTPPLQQIWLSGILPFTGGGWDVGISIRIGAEIMLEQVNQKVDLLPGYNLNIVWQDGLCDGAHTSDLFLKGVFQETFEVFAPGVPLEDLNTDGVGGITTEDADTFSEVWTLDNISAPVGVLGGGCSGETKAINNAAYMARFPIVSGASTFPGLSDRTAYPNFWRTIMPDTNFPAAWMTMAKMFGFFRTTVVIGETEVWKDMSAVVVAAASSEGMQLDGIDLSDEMTAGFKGYQISLDSESAASEAAKGLREQKNRVVMSLMYGRRNRILFCEAHKLGLDNFIWMVMGWLPSGWWKKADTDCSEEVVTQMAWGMITANMQFWRSDMDSQLHCSESMTARGFQAEWMARQKVTPDTLLEPTSDGFMPALESATVADAVCMYSQMLHAMLHEHDFSLEDLQRRGKTTYEKEQELFAATSFEGISGRIQFKPGAADPEGSVLMQHLQAVTGRFVHIASYGSSDGLLTFLGLNDLKFKLPGESYFAGPPGATTVEAPLAQFAACRSGQTLNFADNICEDCSDSQEFVGEMGYCACKPGYAVSDGVCVDCLAGAFSTKTGSTSCEACPVGRFTAGDRETTCSRCEVGRYQGQPGQTGCEPCPDTFTTNGEGGESIADCWCGPGTRLGPEGLCEDCGDESVSGLVCHGGGDVRVAEGFFAEDESFSVFKCFGDAAGSRRCIGGGPGDVCAAGRGGLACSSCMAGLKEHSFDGTCVPCDDGTPGYVALVVTLVGSVCLLTALYMAIDRRGTSAENHTLLLCALVFSLVITSTQQLGILSMFTQVVWPEPMRPLMKKMTVVNFDTSFLNLGCVTDTSALSRFIVSASIMVVSTVVLLLIHGIMVILFHGGVFQGRMPPLIGSIGTVFMVFYISMISVVVGPLQCVQHPNEKWTVRSFPTVICWETDEHLAMVGIGMVALMLPLAYLAKCILSVWLFPSMMRQGNMEFLQTFYFLFFRYTPGAYWYSLVHMFRNLILAALPIIPSVALQLIGMQAVLIAQFYCVIRCRPWRVPAANSMEVFYTTAMMFVVASSSFFASKGGENFLAWVSMLLIFQSLLILPVVAMFATYRTLFPAQHRDVQFFICHHKAGAGSFARLLKIQLQQTEGVTGKVLIDCDMLKHLDVLFDHLANKTLAFVVLGSRELFLRLCAIGELATAMVNQVPTVRLALPDFEELSEAFIEGYEAHVKDFSILTNRGLSLDDAKAALRWSCGLTTIKVDVTLDDTSLVGLAQRLVSSHDACAARQWGSGKRSMSKASSNSAQSHTLIIRDGTSLEARAAGMVLVRMLCQHLEAFPELIPGVLASGERVPTATSRLLLLCTAGALEQLGFFQALHFAAHSAAVCLPVVVDDTFRYPSAIFRDDHMHLAMSVSGNEKAATLLLNDVLDLFKAVAVGFRAARASEAALTTSSAHIAGRLIDLGHQAQVGRWGSFPRTSAMAQEQQDDEIVEPQDTGAVTPDSAAASSFVCADQPEPLPPDSE